MTFRLQHDDVEPRCNEISSLVLDAAFEIHRGLGPGLLEKTYRAILSDELRAKGLLVEEEKELPVYWKGRRIEQGLRMDLIVEGRVVVEVKATRAFAPHDLAQTLTYLKMSRATLGLVLNFGLFPLGVRRVVSS